MGNASVGQPSALVCSGDQMPAFINGPESPSRQNHILVTITLLDQALRTVDQIGDIPEVGARLQMLIDALSGELEEPSETPIQIRSTLVPDRTNQ